MIRLGSLAGYHFEGPARARRLDRPGHARRSTRSSTSPTRRQEQYAVIYVDHSDDLSAERFPFRHPRASCWVQAGR